MDSAVRLNTFYDHFTQSSQETKTGEAKSKKEVREERFSFKPRPCQWWTWQEQERVKVERRINEAKVE